MWLRKEGQPQRDGPKKDFMVPLLANAGMPMLLVQTPVFIVALPIVIGIEALICVKSLQIPKKSAFGAAAAANLVSTLIGFPVLWGVLFLVQILIGAASAAKFPEPWLSVYLVTAQAPWLLPYEEKLYWMIPTAMLVLLVPAFFMSVPVEYFFYRRIIQKKVSGADFWNLSWKVNAASYGFLALAGFGLLAGALLRH